MKKLPLRGLFVAVVIFGLTASAAHAVSVEHENSENGLAGAVIGTVVVGFGVGQAIQGRYSTSGWKFTVADATGVGAAAVGGALAAIGVVNANSTMRGASTGMLLGGGALAIGGVLLLCGSRIWSLVDLWTAPKLLRSAQVAPVVSTNYNGVALALHF